MLKILKDFFSLFFTELFKKEESKKPSIPVVIEHTSTTASPNYKYLWDKTLIDESVLTELMVIEKNIMANLHHYKRIEMAIGVPWWVVAGIHYRESSLSFSGVLHNGEKIIGTGKKTSKVPANRGPFKTWEDAAIDALKIELHKKKQGSDTWVWLEFCEAYNGLGYRKKGVYSPYVFSGTNHYTRGKYVADGKYDSSVKDKQLGIAPIAKILIQEPKINRG